MKKYAKVINNETKLCEVGLGTNSKFYQSIGMSEMDVEQAWDGAWYVAGHTPEEPKKTVQEQNEVIRATREQLYTQISDKLRNDYLEAEARGLPTAENLKADWLASKDKIREENPYVTI